MQGSSVRAVPGAAGPCRPRPVACECSPLFVDPAAADEVLGREPREARPDRGGTAGTHRPGDGYGRSPGPRPARPSPRCCRPGCPTGAPASGGAPSRGWCAPRAGRCSRHRPTPTRFSRATRPQRQQTPSTAANCLRLSTAALLPPETRSAPGVPQSQPDPGLGLDHSLPASPSQTPSTGMSRGRPISGMTLPNAADSANMEAGNPTLEEACASPTTSPP